MSDDLTPAQAVWGKFYFELHQAVERLEAIANGDTRQDGPKAMAKAEPHEAAQHTVIVRRRAVSDKKNFNPN